MCYYRLYTIRKFFLMFVLDNFEEYMMLRNLYGRDYMHSYEDETYYRNQF